MTTEILAERLKGETDQRGWSLREVGRRSGFSVTMIADIAKGAR
jgi:transcriptional regulator with XRE-family HTH domain